MLKIECYQQLSYRHIYGNTWLVSSVDDKLGAFHFLLCGKNGGRLNIQFVDGIGVNAGIYNVHPVKKLC